MLCYSLFTRTISLSQCTRLDPKPWPRGYVPSRMKHAFPVAPGWKRGPNPWPWGHEFYDIEDPIQCTDRLRVRHHLCQVYIVYIVTDRLTGRMGSEPILSIKWSVSMYTMIKFDGDEDGDGNGTCKQTLIPVVCPIQLFYVSGTSAHIVKQLVPLSTTSTDTSIENTVLKRQITGNMHLCVPKYLRFRLHLSVIIPMAIRSILEIDKYLQFLCVPPNCHLADLQKSIKW